MVESLCCLNILLLGIITSFYDIKDKKIPNRFLVTALCAGTIMNLWMWTHQGPPTTGQLIGIPLTILGAAAMFHEKMWRGGDAKLFITYAILMPPTLYDHLLITPPASLFINTFLIATLFILPSIIRENIRDPKILFQHFTIESLSQRLISSFTISFFISWIFLPLIKFTGLNHEPVTFTLSMCTLYLFCSPVLTSLRKYPWINAGVFATGFIIRLFGDPSSLSPQALFQYVQTLIIYTAVFSLFQIPKKKILSQKERIPFAPFLFAGLLLSYTPCLNFILTTIRHPAHF